MYAKLPTNYRRPEPAPADPPPGDPERAARFSALLDSDPRWRTNTGFDKLVRAGHMFPAEAFEKLGRPCPSDAPQPPPAQTPSAPAPAVPPDPHANLGSPADRARGSYAAVGLREVPAATTRHNGPGGIHV